MKKVKICELWHSKTEMSYTFFPEDNERVRKSLEKDAELIWKCEATSWTDANNKKNKYLGWGYYQPMEPDNDSWDEY